MGSGVVGVDIGSTAIRAVEVKGAGEKPAIKRVASIALPPGLVDGGVIVRPAEVAKALKQLWDDNKLGEKTVRLGVGSSSVLVRPLELDWMPEADLKKSLRYQIEGLLPVPVDDANIDHIYLGEVTYPADGENPERRMLRILLTATAREGVDEMVRTVQSVKLKPEHVDLGALALIRASAIANPDGKPEAILDIGVDKVTIAIHTKGRPHLIRVMPNMGSGPVTRQLVEDTGRSWPEAEKIKCSGIPLPTPGNEPASQDQAVIYSGVRRFLSAARDALEFHANTDPASFPERVLIHGGLVALPGLVEQAQHILGIEAMPFGGNVVAAAGGPNDANYALAYGLCMEMTAQ